MTGLSASMASVTNQAQLSQRDICPATQGSGPPLHAGEWLITYEVFRDLGIAFAAVLVPVLPDTAIIAGAGIMVRNPIILVDFIELRLAEGMAPDAAEIDAGALRFRPTMLTAAAVVVGSSIILFDPIFQGLAIAPMAGGIASLPVSRMTVPVPFCECRPLPAYDCQGLPAVESGGWLLDEPLLVSLHGPEEAGSPRQLNIGRKQDPGHRPATR
jgi:hypothetical protein